MVKPSAVCHLGEILDMIQEAEFEIIGLKMIKIDRKKAKIFYDIHKGKSFFESIIYTITKRHCVVMVLKKKNAVNAWRKLLGHKDPSQAEEGTIRNKFGFSINDNGAHGSDSDENAEKEINLFFSKKEIF